MTQPRHLVERIEQDGPASIEAELSVRLGFPVRVDKVANRILVYRNVEVGVKVSEVVEYELMAYSGDPLDLLVRGIGEEVPLPPMVRVRREDLVRMGSAIDLKSLGEGYDRTYNLKTTTPGLCVPTEHGPVPLQTFSTTKHLDILLAKNDLANMLTTLAEADTTIVVLGEPKSYQDAISKTAQAWCDCVVLPGAWYWDDSRCTMVCSREYRPGRRT